MFHQRFLREISLFRLTLRKMGVLFFLPAALLFVCLPILSFGYISFYGNCENAQALIFFDSQKLIPFVSCWWVLLGLSDYVDGNSGELLQVHKKNIVDLFCLLFFWYSLHAIILFSGYWLLIDNFWPDFPIILTQMLAFSASGFFFLVLTKNLLTPFLLALVYELFAMATNSTALRFLSIFSLQRVTTLEQLIPYALIFLCSVLLLAAGEFCYKKIR